MNNNIIAYRIIDIPDPYYPQHQMAAGGDVLTAAANDCEHILRTLANMIPGHASLTIRFIFSPNSEEKDLQSRLRIYILAQTPNDDFIDSLKVLLERGPFSRFYKLHQSEHPIPFISSINTVCHIVRREDALNPLHSPEFNDRIPQYYYTIEPFKPNESNNYISLDRVLSDVHENVIVDISVEPTNVANELLAHTRYLSQLQSINRRWDIDEDDETELQNYIDDESTSWEKTWRKGLKPLRYQDPLADDIIRFQQRFHETLRQPHLQFHICIYTETLQVAQLIGSVVGEAGFKGGSYRTLTYSKGEVLFEEAVKNFNELRISAKTTLDHLFNGTAPSLYSGFIRLRYIATVDELLGIFRLPVASTTSPKCIRKNTDPPIESPEGLIALGEDQEGSRSTRGVNIAQLCKHAFVSGVPGTGKTTSIINIILQLHKNKIPFLVLEPAKSEYRILKTFRNHSDENARQIAQELHVYTPGAEDVSPLRHNPLELRPGISLNEHIDTILSCFLASMPVFGPLPALLGEALEKIYEQFRERDNPPIMADLIAAAEQVLSEKEYSGDTNSDFRAALEVRLGVLVRRSIGKVFQCRHSVPDIDRVMKIPTIIELERLPQTQACLLTLFLLTSIREYLITAPPFHKKLRYVIIIEEAHNIVGRTSTAIPSPDIADPKAFAAEFICRMLAELRALGVGIIIIDQLPSAVAPEVIKNTASKLAFRQVAKDDREELGAAMLFNQTEIEEIARLKTGEAFYYTEGYHGPRKIMTADLSKEFDFSTMIANQNIIPFLKDDKWYQEVTIERGFAELSLIKEQIDHFDDIRLIIIHELAGMIELQPKILSITNQNKRIKKNVRLREKAQKLKQRLSNTYELFIQKTYRNLINFELGYNGIDSSIGEMKNNLIERLDSIIEPDVKKTFDILDELIERHQAKNHLEVQP